MFGKMKDLNEETQVLIATGSAIASGCQPCLESIIAQANKLKISNDKLKAAAIIGQFVSDQPALHMKQFTDQLLGTHLSHNAPDLKCPAENSGTTAGRAQPQCGCGCS